MCYTFLECKFVSSIITIILLIIGFFVFMFCYIDLDFFYYLLIIISFCVFAFINVFITLYLYNRIIYIRESNIILNNNIKEFSDSYGSDEYNNIL